MVLKLDQWGATLVSSRFDYLLASKDNFPTIPLLDPVQADRESKGAPNSPGQQIGRLLLDPYDLCNEPTSDIIRGEDSLELKEEET